MANPQLTQAINFTKEQQEVLNGALLGDGCLYLHSDGKNAQFIYTSKSKQHVEYVGLYFKDYWSGESIKDSSYFDSRTEKEYFRSTVKTYTNESFTRQYYKWYVNGKKHLPDTLELTPLTCLIWYIGDGGICKSNRTEYIKLSTQCFSKEEQEKILIPQLCQFEATLMKADLSKNDEQQYYIYIPHRKEQEFLKYIGDCPFSDYSYKWDFSPYKNAIPQNHSSNEKIFCEMYQSGISYYQIAKQFNIEPNAVKYYLQKNKIYKSQNNSITKNAVIQYDLETNNPLNIYKSSSEAALKLNISPSGISNVVGGRRESAGGFFWKKYLNLTKEEQENIQVIFKDYFN